MKLVEANPKKILITKKPFCASWFQENDDESEVNNVENKNPSYDDSLFHFEEM